MIFIELCYSLCHCEVLNDKSLSVTVDPHDKLITENFNEPLCNIDFNHSMSKTLYSIYCYYNKIIMSFYLSIVLLFKSILLHFSIHTVNLLDVSTFNDV